MNQPKNQPNPYGSYQYSTPYQQSGNVSQPQGQPVYQQQQQPYPYQQGQQYQSTQQVPVAPSMPTSSPQIPGMLPVEASYIENILRLNKGKLATVYTTFENNKEWNAKIFKGIIEAAGRDHLIISDPQSGIRYLIPMVYLDYVSFDEEIEYEYPFGGSQVNLTSYPPR